LDGQAEDLYEVFDRLATNLFLLFGKNIVQECESLLAIGIFTNVQN